MRQEREFLVRWRGSASQGNNRQAVRAGADRDCIKHRQLIAHAFRQRTTPAVHSGPDNTIWRRAVEPGRDRSGLVAVSSIRTEAPTPAVTPEPGKGGHHFSLSISDIVTIIGPVGLLTGILYYFGYVSAEAYYSYFGISLSALDLPADNYLLGDADTFFKPAAALLIGSIIIFAAHHLVSQLVGRLGKALLTGLVAGVSAVTAALAIFGLLGLFGTPGGLASAVALAVAGLLAEYVVWIAARSPVTSDRFTAAMQRGKNLRRGLLLSLVLVAIFWAVADMAYQRGISEAQLVEFSLPLRSQAVVYSDRDLDIPGSDVGRTVLRGTDSAYRYRYNGLRPLLYAHDRWFLLPVSWTRNNGETVIVLQDDPGHMRVDLAP